MADRALQAMYSQVHAAQPARFVGLLHAADRQVASGVATVRLHEAGALHVHAARPAGRIQQPPSERLHDFSDQNHQRRRRKELAPLLALAAGEFPEEVFVDPSERIKFQIGGDLGDALEQRCQQLGRKQVVAAGQHPGELAVGCLDQAHRRIELLANVRPLR